MNGCMAIYRRSRCDDHQPETTPQAEINYSIKNLNIHIPNQHLNRVKLLTDSSTRTNICKCKRLIIYCDYLVIYSSAASLIDHRRESRLTNTSKTHFYKRLQNSRSDFTGIEHESDHIH